jgi:hypothetical protein
MVRIIVVFMFLVYGSLELKDLKIKFLLTIFG